MSSTTPGRLAVLCIATWSVATGCRPTATTLSPEKESVGVPRILELPARIRPISVDDSLVVGAAETRSVPAQFQQLQAPPPLPGPRIRELAVPHEQKVAGGPICEPGAAAQVITEPPVAPSPTSQFVPIAMPLPAVPPPPSSLPELPAKPTFTAQPPVGGQVFQPAVPAAPPNDSSPAADAINSPAPVGQVFTPAPSPALENAADKHVYVTNTNFGAVPAAAQRAVQITDRAAAMAERGMLYSARAELLQALQLIAQALDVQQGGAQHAAALAAGLTSLAEARDFSTPATSPAAAVSVAAIAASHRTTILHNIGKAPLSPVVAQQQYFEHAQSQIAAAVGSIPASSQILYLLGRLHTATAAHDADPLALRGPEAIVFHQAALTTDNKNWLAANELGVLFARYGQLPDARRLLVYSVTIHPHAEGWHNLAVVHRRLGETDLAQRAEHERQLLTRQTGKSPSDSNDRVRWVDPRTFAASGGPDIPWPAAAPSKAVAAAPGAPRR